MVVAYGTVKKGSIPVLPRCRSETMMSYCKFRAGSR